MAEREWRLGRKVEKGWDREGKRQLEKMSGVTTTTICDLNDQHRQNCSLLFCQLIKTGETACICVHLSLVNPTVIFCVYLLQYISPAVVYPTFDSAVARMDYKTIIKQYQQQTRQCYLWRTWAICWSLKPSCLADSKRSLGTLWACEHGRWLLVKQRDTWKDTLSCKRRQALHKTEYWNFVIIGRCHHPYHRNISKLNYKI